jgi:uncharacterized membrane protein
LLSADGIEAALGLTGLRPGPAERREFGVRAMRFAGVLSLASGIIFLIAFNWQHMSVYTRFALIQVPLLAAVLVAWFNGVDELPGKLALLFAVLTTGALLALFGQTYQTGADVDELFLGWALLALPWVIACRYAPCWALWLLLANAAMGLYVGFDDHGWLIELFRSHWGWSPWSLSFLLNLLLYITLLMLARWPQTGLGAAWLRRGLMAVAMACGTFAMIYRIFAGGDNSEFAAIGLEVLLFLAASVGFVAQAYAQKDDLFNFAVLALSWISITAFLLGRALIESSGGIGVLFVIALYVIGASTAAVKGLSQIGKHWKTGEVAA